MEFQKLTTSKRNRSGKGPARRLRQQGLVPAILYGHGIETTSLAIDPRSLSKALSGPMRTNTLLELEINGTKEGCTAMVRDHQFDPVSRKLLHVDLLAVDLGREIEVQVPLDLQGRSRGEQLGGTLSKLFRTLPVKCYPRDIPEAITHDITQLDIHAILTAGALEMPQNVTLLLDDKTPVVTIAAKRVEVQETEEGEEAAEGEAAPEAEAEAEEKTETPAS